MIHFHQTVIWISQTRQSLCNIILDSHALLTRGTSRWLAIIYKSLLLLSVKQLINNRSVFILIYLQHLPVEVTIRCFGVTNLFISYNIKAKLGPVYVCVCVFICLSLAACEEINIFTTHLLTPWVWNGWISSFPVNT